ncbi:MAG: AAA family ATPase [Thermomicrobiales bacterium]
MSDTELSPAAFGTAFKAFMEAVLLEATTPDGALLERIRTHLGVDPAQLSVTTEAFDTFDHPNVQVALDHCLSMDGRTAELAGVGSDHKHYLALGLSDLLSRGSGNRPPLTEGPVDYVNFHLADGKVLPCVQFGLYLVADGEERFVVFLAGPHEHGPPDQKLRVEVMATRPEVGQAFLAELVEDTKRFNVYRGHVISLSPGELGMGRQSLVVFHNLPKVERDDLILPEGALERIERHTVVFAQHAERLLAAGRSLKRGLLLHGPPGTGKTLTVMYLTSRMPERTVVLTTGFGMGLLRLVAQLARSLAPAMVVLEDVDLIAEERGMSFSRTGPLLFELLNEMDGLRDDSDVIFVLTTNRPDTLEPALAARPGRIDLAVELPLPDAEGRRRLLELYAKGLELRDVDFDRLVKQTEGASPAYIKELLRKAAVLAAAESAELVVTGAHLEAALAEFSEGGKRAQRILGFHPAGDFAREPAVPGRPVAPDPMGTDWVGRGRANR